MHARRSPLVAVASSESGRYVVAAKMTNKGKLKVATPPGIDRTPVATPSSATSVTSSLMVLPGTDKPMPLRAARTGTRMNLSTGRGCRGNETDIFNRRVLKGIMHLHMSRHPDPNKADSTE